MATHSSVLDWKIPGTGEPGGWPSLGLHTVGHDWSDLAAAAVPVIRLTSFLWLWFQCVCPLMLSRNTYVGFSYLGHELSLHGCSSKAQPLLLTLEEGYLLMVVPPDLERGVAPLGPPAPAQPPLLGHGVAPLSRRPWPRTWDNSSRLLLRRHSLVLSFAAPWHVLLMRNLINVRNWEGCICISKFIRHQSSFKK